MAIKRNDNDKELYKNSPRRKAKIIAIASLILAVVLALLSGVVESGGLQAVCFIFAFLLICVAIVFGLIMGKYCPNCGKGKPRIVDSKTTGAGISNSKNGAYAYKTKELSCECGVCGYKWKVRRNEKL